LIVKLISSRETLDFLTKSAPRPWVKRMLLWMIYNGEIIPFFNKGRSVATVSAFSIIFDALGGDWKSESRDELIRKHFEPEMADKLIAAKDMDNIEEVAYEWAIDDGPREVAAGYFVFATAIDWDQGLVEAQVESDQSNDEHLFWDADELLASDFKDPSYFLTLSGLCFELERIEMLQPSTELVPQPHGAAEQGARMGRPRTWDWDGATTHLLTIAQTPDGLPTGPGAQAQIERRIADWFMTTTGNAPAESQVRQHSTKIMRALKRPKG
jgi:hypothetical protein